jgi:uncharacterized protein YaiI (UPF0178 family)
MLNIYVDGDACPVKGEIFRVAERHKLKVYLVSNSWHRIGVNIFVEQVVVSQGPDIADDWIAERIDVGDIVVTSDIPLADRCIKNAACAIAPTGKTFTPDSIGMALAIRNLMTDLRETGEVTGSNPSFTKQDRSRFLSELETQIMAIKRQSICLTQAL